MISQSQNVWEMYETSFLNVFFSMMPRYDVNKSYIKVVERKTCYRLAKEHSKIIEFVQREIKNNNFYYRKCIKMYEKCIRKKLN